MHTDFGVQAKGVKKGAIVEIIRGGGPVPDGDDPLVAANLTEISIDSDGKQTFGDGAPTPGDVIQLVELQVDVQVDAERLDTYTGLATHPDQKRYIQHILQRDDPENENAVVWLDWDPTASPNISRDLLVALRANSGIRLTGGDDGALPLLT